MRSARCLAACLARARHRQPIGQVRPFFPPAPIVVACRVAAPVRVRRFLSPMKARRCAGRPFFPVRVHGVQRATHGDAVRHKQSRYQAPPWSVQTRWFASKRAGRARQALTHAVSNRPQACRHAPAACSCQAPDWYNLPRGGLRPFRSSLDQTRPDDGCSARVAARNTLTRQIQR